MPTARYYFGAAQAGDGYIYVIGGDNYTNVPLNVVEGYDSLTDSWETRADLSTPRWRLGAAASANGKIYAIGGGNLVGSLDTVEEYDALTDTWIEKNADANPTYRARCGRPGWKNFCDRGLE
jgi:hypothetical protein